jgi:hypothetical protein
MLEIKFYVVYYESPTVDIWHLAMAILPFLRFGLTATSLFPLPGECFAVTVIDPHEGVTPFVVTPMERRLNRSAGHPGPLQQIKGNSHDRTLHLTVPGLPTGISQWEVGKYEAGHTAFLHDVAGRAQHCGWHGFFFQVSGGQTHGLVADRSECREEEGVNPILPCPFQDLRGVPK